MNYFRKIQSKYGFTVIDVLATMGIIVLLAAISIPYIKKYQPNMKLNGASRELTSDLRLAQQLTVTEQVVHSLVVDLDNDSYKILKLGTATTTVKTVSFDQDVDWESITGLTDNKVVFNYYGGVIESGEINLINVNGKKASVNVKPSGYIQLQ